MSVDPMLKSGVTPLPDGLEILPMTEADLNQVVVIEQQSFPDPWPRRFFHEELVKLDPAYARVARADSQVAGYLIAWFILDEVHLGNLAVHRAHRRRGIGRALVEDLVLRAGRHGSSFITLEVRAGNRGAISLYTSLLFQPVAVRKGYYSGREDAIIMLREFGKRPPAAS
jgi:ribosomal-protein-alanine N-acetyltransferase